MQPHVGGLAQTTAFFFIPRAPEQHDRQLTPWQMKVNQIDQARLRDLRSLKQDPVRHPNLVNFNDRASSPRPQGQCEGPLSREFPQMKFTYSTEVTQVPDCCPQFVLAAGNVFHIEFDPAHGSKRSTLKRGEAHSFQWLHRADSCLGSVGIPEGPCRMLVHVYVCMCVYVKTRKDLCVCVRVWIITPFTWG